MSTLISLETLDRGGVVEVFGGCLQEVLENIKDPNTRAEGVREITITFKFKPGKERNHTNMTYSTKTKLQPVEPVEIPLFVDKDRNTKKAIGYELWSPDEHPDQHRLDGVDKEKASDKVTDLDRARNG